jgi:hypothetical protein
MKGVFLSCLVLCYFSLFSQGRVGIGTTSPDTSALVDMTSDSKGVLFPRMTTAQRNMISNPHDGLHIYNTDQGCLNYYDNQFQIWNCYCVFDTCHTVTISITQNVDHEIDFMEEYASRYPGQRKFKVVVDSNVVIMGQIDTIGNQFGVFIVPRSGINFDSMPAGTEVLLINYGVIVGRGGLGGRGAGAGTCGASAQTGVPAGHGVVKDGTVSLTIQNYGLIAGGGGGGGGGGGNGSPNYGGGGGGGAGFGSGGTGGGFNFSSGGFPPICVYGSPEASSGVDGLDTSGGTGGAGTNGGGTGGNGGFLGMPGSDGTGTNFGTGGAGGKAISGAGAMLTNFGMGLVLGAVD